ncbi:MAG: putative glycoside hydrolase [Anaerolineae bacterium]|nr:putative glycoside hydrolase family 15 protein [Thermoflexales bacterium]MDW8408438.1 putative glycoside hydrolase [Anaerolineae bacterium]
MALALLAGLGVPACGAALPARQTESIFPSPVAFVTAAPLPEATATPTPPPTAEPTQPPPTLAPKRMPIDSTAAIGLWSSRITSTQSFTGVVDLAQGPVGFDLRNNNLALVTLTSRQVYYGFADTVAEVAAQNPDWFLYDKNKRVALASNGAPLLNIRNDQIKQQLADDIRRLVYEQGYDGIILEGVGVDLIRASNSPIFTGTKTFTDEQRRSTVEALLRAVRTVLPDKLMIVGGYAWEDGSAFNARVSEAQELASLADGVHITHFLRTPYSGTLEFKSESNWKRDIDYLASISRDGKIVLITTAFAASDVSPEALRQWLGYSVASYLMGKNGPRTYFQFDPAGSLDFAADPILTAPVGAPLEAYTKLDNGVYRRSFANVLVLVNPTTKVQEIDLGGDYRTLSGDMVQKVTMSANTGLILLKP